MNRSTAVNGMNLVTVKNKFQLVIPQSVRKQLGINLGDTLEVKVERGKLTYTPKTVVVIDRASFPNADDEYTPAQRRKIDAQLKEARSGPFFGPFKNGEDIAVFLKTMKAPTSSAKKRMSKP